MSFYSERSLTGSLPNIDRPLIESRIEAVWMPLEQDSSLESDFDVQVMLKTRFGDELIVEYDRLNEQ